MNSLFFTSMREIGGEVSQLARRMEEQKAAFEVRIEEQKAALETQMEEEGIAFEARIKALSGEVSNLIAENRTLTTDLQFSNDLLARNRAYFGALAEKNGVAGYIIDLKSEGNILVYIDPLYGLSFKDRQAVVFRTGNEYIGLIRVSGDDRVFTASVVELSPGKRIEAGDRILLGGRGGF
jgi:hypothetical protein